MIETIRTLIAEHGRLPVAADTLGETQDLYAAGLTSFAAVQLMLALEDRFEVEFPDSMLNRRSFASIAAIRGCIETLNPKTPDLETLDVKTIDPVTVVLKSVAA